MNAIFLNILDSKPACSCCVRCVYFIDDDGRHYNYTTSMEDEGFGGSYHFPNMVVVGYSV